VDHAAVVVAIGAQLASGLHNVAAAGAVQVVGERAVPVVERAAEGHGQGAVAGDGGARESAAAAGDALGVHPLEAEVGNHLVPVHRLVPVHHLPVDDAVAVTAEGEGVYQTGREEVGLHGGPGVALAQASGRESRV